MHQDDAECEAWARTSAGSGGEATAGGAVGGAVLGSALGAGLGAIAGSFFGAADTGAAMGAALGGTSGAAHGAAGSAAAWDARLLAAYRNCMAARGYVVEGAVVIPNTAPNLPPSEASSDARLRSLEALHKEGLVTDQEYKMKRADILGYEERTAEDRLRELKGLLGSGLISDAEYHRKRREIIQEL